MTGSSNHGVIPRIRGSGHEHRHTGLLEALAGEQRDDYDLLPIGCVSTGSDCKIRHINRAGAAMLGWTAEWLVGRPLGKWVVADDAARFAAHWRAVTTCPGAASVRLRVKNRAGRVHAMRWHSVSAGGALIGDGAAGASETSAARYLTVLIDESDHGQEPQEQAAGYLESTRQLRAGRMTVVGELAASLVHELSHPVGAILLTASAGLKIARAQSAADMQRFEEILQRICDAANGAAEVVRDLRRFVRAASAERRPVDLNALIGAAARLLGRTARDRNVAISLCLAPDLPRVRAHEVQIQQVIVNLVRNAIEAAAGGAKQPREVIVASEPAPGCNVRCSVVDNGSGVAREHVSRVFEPFFTTKPDALGLGLSICRSIVEAHGGQIWLEESNAARGALFYCSLPVAEER